MNQENESISASLQMDAADPVMQEIPKDKVIPYGSEGNSQTIIFGDDVGSATNRSFTIRDLKQPGGWKTSSELTKVLDLSQEYQLKFNRTDPAKKPKVGKVYCLFGTVKEAQQAYTVLSTAKIDGQPVRIDIAENFVIPGEDDYFKPSTDEQVRSRTIYALNLVSTSKEFLETIFGQEAIESVKFLPQEGDKQQAEVVMSSQEEAASAKQDANALDDDDPSSSMKVLTPDEYLVFVEEGKNRGKSHQKPAETQEMDNKENEEVQLAPEIEEEDVIAALNTQVILEKLNWAELNEVEELYQICDKVSAKFGGLPDSILKPAMLSTLIRHHGEAEFHWMREHIQGLTQIWRRETESEVPFVRDTQVIMRSVQYEPVLVNNTRKRKARGSKAARIMMGVGALLQATKETMRTENGEVEVDEDESGNYMLNGEALSFDNWAKFTKTSQPDVFVMEKQVSKGTPEQQPQLNGKKKKRGWIDDPEDYKKFKKAQFEKRMGHKKLKIMDQARREVEELENQERAGSAAGSEPTSQVETPTQEKPPKELDEGEIDSEEERQMDKKKKKKHSSDSDSSSEESDDDSGDAAKNARSRRAQMRKAKLKKQAAANPLSTPILQQLFDFRHQVVKLLPLSQKIHLTQFLREATGTSTQDLNLYRQFSDDVTRLSY